MKAKAMSCGASMLVIMLLLFPTGAYAQFGDIFSAILSTITGPIGGALTDIQRDPQLDLKDRAAGTVAPLIDYAGAELYFDD